MNASLPRVADNASPGEKLWYYRELREMTREELGEKLGLKAGGVQNLEGRNNAIHYKNALIIGEILDIDPEILLDEFTRFCSPGCGERVKQIRFAWKMTQAVFADMMGIDRSSIARWEVDYSDIHLNRTMYHRLKELAAEKGMDMETLTADPYAYDNGYMIGLSVKTVAEKTGISVQPMESMRMNLRQSSSGRLWSDPLQILY